MDCGCAVRNERSYRFRRPVISRIPCDTRTQQPVSLRKPLHHTPTTKTLESSSPQPHSKHTAFARAD